MRHLLITFIMFNSLTLFAEQNQLNFQNLSGTYDLHLYFATDKPFKDQLVLKVDSENQISGSMIVPNDFTVNISNFTLQGTSFSFEYVVPKNDYRPQDIHVRYFGHFYDKSFKSYTGFAQIKNSQEFFANFVGFKIP